ncbi:hypothetical protein CPB83DRAFT_69983 [Crepidotus variabilis]|uniref:F-box domain-containing protein n=1 Tax=Crepidotus variabilis TaxID=179855 RepID=A0A9P6E5M4_9AGAR|nr:hypothetical protein CPB83DRAFT_69983 [Crepidotus variabilis]
MILSLDLSSVMTSNNADSSVELPFEVIDLIIEELAKRDDKSALRSFALVSHSFVVRCQKHLLYTVDLGDKRITGEKYYRLFSRVINKHPHFRLYVRDLRIVDTYVWDPRKDWKWLVKEESICDVLESLPNLESFSLFFNTCTPVWSSFSSCLRNAIIRLTRRPSIKSLSLSNIRDVPPSIFGPLLSVNNLKLNNIQAHRSCLFTTPEIPRKVEYPLPSLGSLTTLTLGSMSTSTMRVLCSTLSESLMPSLLQRLRITLVDQKQPELIEELWGLMQWASKSLTHVEWRTLTLKSSVAHRPPHPIDLQLFTSLRSLRFPVNFHCLEQPVFLELLQVLRQVASGCHLQELIVESMFVNSMELVARASDWSLLDNTLSGKSFNSLDRIVFGGRWRTLPQSVKDSAKAILLEQLPFTRANGVSFFFDMDL